MRACLNDLLPPSTADQLGRQLDNLLSQSDDPTCLPSAVDFALEALHEHDPARRRLLEELRADFGAKESARLSNPPGYPIPLAPGIRVCCPVDPTHLQARLRVQGQRCQQHNVLLVPCDLLAGASTGGRK